MRFDPKAIAVVLVLLAVDSGLAFNPNDGVSFQGKQRVVVTSRRSSSSAVVVTRMSTEVDEE